MQRQHRLLAAVTALHAVVGTWIATATPGPLLSADDLAYFAMGRTLAGEGVAPLAAQPPYGVLYPGLLAPGWLFGLDETAMLGWARTLNAVLGALLIPVLFFLIRRLTRAERGMALAAAVIGASLPAALLTSSIAWTETLLALLLAGAVLALLRVHETATTGRVLAVVALAVALFATHPRMGLASVVLVVAAAALSGRASPARAAISVAVGGGGIVLAEWVRRLLADAAFDDTGIYTLGDLASRRGFSQTPEMLIHGGGAVAYLMLSTAGLAAIGLVVLWRNPPVGRWIVASLVAIVAVAGWFLTGVERSDAYLHGRYVEVFAPIAVAVGIAGVRELSLWLVTPAVAGVTILSGFFGAWAGPGNNWDRPRSPVMMLGTEVGGAPFGNDVFEPGAAASMALIAGLVIVVVARYADARWLVAAALTFAALGVASGVEVLDQLHELAIAGEVEAGLDGIEIESIVLDTSSVSPNLVGAIAWHVGFDNATTTLSPESTHLLLPPGAVGPPSAQLLVEFSSGSIWTLR